jgi:hypothetical protein
MKKQMIRNLWRCSFATSPLKQSFFASCPTKNNTNTVPNPPSNHPFYHQVTPLSFSSPTSSNNNTNHHNPNHRNHNAWTRRLDVSPWKHQHQNQQRLSRWKSSSEDEDDNDKVDLVWRSPPPHPKDDGNGNANANGDDSDATDPPPLLLQHAVSLLEELRVMGNYLLSQDDAVVVDDGPAPFGAFLWSDNDNDNGSSMGGQ